MHAASHVRAVLPVAQRYGSRGGVTRRGGLEPLRSSLSVVVATLGALLVLLVPVPSAARPTSALGSSAATTGVAAGSNMLTGRRTHRSESVLAEVSTSGTMSSGPRATGHVAAWAAGGISSVVAPAHGAGPTLAAPVDRTVRAAVRRAVVPRATSSAIDPTGTRAGTWSSRAPPTV